jgi:hypothetical protein
MQNTIQQRAGFPTQLEEDARSASRSSGFYTSFQVPTGGKMHVRSLNFKTLFNIGRKTYGT